MNLNIIHNLIEKIEIGFRGKFTTEESFELEKIFENVETEKQVDETYISLCDIYKYAKLPNIATIVRAVYAVGLRKKIKLGIQKVCDCGKCLEGQVSVFDLHNYLFYEHECEGWKKGGIDGIYAIPIMSTWCYNFKQNERNIHTYLEEIQDYESNYFEFAYIRLWHEYCSLKTLMNFDEFNPYAFWGMGKRSAGMRRITKSQIKNEYLKSEIEDRENCEEVKFDKIEEETFESFLDRSNKEFVNKSEW